MRFKWGGGAHAGELGDVVKAGPLALLLLTGGGFGQTHKSIISFSIFWMIFLILHFLGPLPLFFNKFSPKF